MKIAVLHGAIINAGDFLIKNRAISLLKYFYPDSEIVEYYRNQSLEEKLPEINACDILVFAGGPGLVLCQDLVQVKMRNFSDFNPPEAQPQCVFFHTLVRIHLVTYSYNGYEFVSYCRKLPDIRKSSGMPACNREF